MKFKFNSDKLVNSLTQLYIFMFIFTMINREFLFFFLDLRYILFVVGCYLICDKVCNMVKHKEKLSLNKLDKLLVIFYIFSLLCNIMWVFNGLEIHFNKIFSMIILYVFNFITILVFIMKRKEIKVDNIYKSIIISGAVLFISIMFITIGGKLTQIMGADIAGKVIGGEHINLLGLNFRVAGYAEDANYATMFMVIWAATAIHYMKNKKKKYLVVFLAVIGMMLSASKTVIMGASLGLIIILLMGIKNDKLQSKYLLLKNIYVAGIVTLPYIALKFIDMFNYHVALNTMSIRFSMWEKAITLFKTSPIVGNGITSFRSYFDACVDGWYVQCHSTIFQLMSESGIVGLVLFALIIGIILKSRNKFVVFLTVTFTMFSLTSELVYLSLFAFIVAVLPFIDMKEKKEQDVIEGKTLFIINSLGKGGAERVVANLANKMAECGQEVTVILMFNNVFYKMNDNIKLIYINEKKPESKVGKLICTLVGTYKLNKMIDENEKEGKYQLITSHLPLSNLICKLSNCNNRCIHVIHNVYSAVEKNKMILTIALKGLYNNCNITTVANGVEKELLERYKVRPKNIKTIYNPIDIKNIKDLSNEVVDEERKYILFCGRLTHIKRPDILIKSFAKGKLYYDYNLVLLGEGELKEDLTKLAKELEVDKYVIFKGWQDNVYKYMRNSELLVSCSEFEALPMNILEALASETKVVSIDCDYGPREIFIGEYKRYLVEKDNENELIKTIKYTLDELDKNVFKLANRFDTLIIVNEYLNTALEWMDKND